MTSWERREKHNLGPLNMHSDQKFYVSTETFCKAPSLVCLDFLSSSSKSIIQSACNLQILSQKEGAQFA